MNKLFKHHSPLLLFVLLLSCFSVPAQADTFNCAADVKWFTSPSMPTEIAKSGKDGTSNFCDFYQFSWQAFAYLMSPVKPGSAIRQYENNKAFYELEVNADGTPANSCDEKRLGNTLFVRVTKSEDAGTTFNIPERINQAGGGATIYDQNKNVVYYDVKFSKNMCNVSKIKKLYNFPAGTTELKTAWKVLKSGEENKYITMNTTIGTDKTPATLGMIGFHIAIATSDHPEFVWATFEHDSNAPDCINPQAGSGWSFTSQQCTTALENKDIRGIINCKFNVANKQSDPTKITGTATEICREYAYGSAKGDLKYDENVQDITTLNKNVEPYLKGPYEILNNYFNVGAIWVSKKNIDSNVSNQRGSLRLANTVAETVHQNVDLKAGFVSNCFGCHNYSATGKNTTSGDLSHIFDDIAIGKGACLDVESGTLINGQSDAKQYCPEACASSSSQFAWNGQWTNKGVPMTVCGCCGKK